MDDLVRQTEVNQEMDDDMTTLKVKAFKFGHDFTKKIVSKVKENQEKKDMYYEASEIDETEMGIIKLKQNVVSFFSKANQKNNNKKSPNLSQKTKSNSNPNSPKSIKSQKTGSFKSNSPKSLN